MGVWEWVMVAGVLDGEHKCMYVLHLKEARHDLH